MEEYETSFLIDSLRRRFSVVTCTIEEECNIVARRYLGAVPLELSVSFSTKGVRMALVSSNERLSYDLYSNGEKLALTRCSWADVLINLVNSIEDSYTYPPSFFGPNLIERCPDLEHWIPREIARVCSFANNEVPLIFTQRQEDSQDGMIFVSVTNTKIVVSFPDTEDKFRCDLSSVNVLKFLGWYRKIATPTLESLKEWFE